MLIELWLLLQWYFLSFSDLDENIILFMPF
jgi:hypothetical protein